MIPKEQPHHPLHSYPTTRQLPCSKRETKRRKPCIVIIPDITSEKEER